MIYFKKEWDKYYQKKYLKIDKEYKKFIKRIDSDSGENYLNIYANILIFFYVLLAILILFLLLNEISTISFILFFLLAFLKICVVCEILFDFFNIKKYLDNKEKKLKKLSNKLFSPEINLVQFNQFLNDVIFNQKFKIKTEYQDVIEKDLRYLSVHLKNNLINYNFNQSTLYKVFIEYINANIQIHPNYIEEKNKLANIISDLNKISSSKAKLDLSNLIKHYYYSSTPLNYFVEFEVDVAGCKTESCLNIIRYNENIIKEYKELFNNQLNMKAQI